MMEKSVSDNASIEDLANEKNDDDSNTMHNEEEEDEEANSIDAIEVGVKDVEHGENEPHSDTIQNDASYLDKETHSVEPTGISSNDGLEDDVENDDDEEEEEEDEEDDDEEDPPPWHLH